MKGLLLLCCCCVVVVLLLCCCVVLVLLTVCSNCVPCSKCAGEKYSIFFGFNYDDWQSANHLVRTNVVNWSTRDVAKWFSFENDLAPIRKYITRDDLNEMDGETLLEVDRYVLLFSIVCFQRMKHVRWIDFVLLFFLSFCSFV